MKQARRDIPVQYLRECFDMSALGELFWKERPLSHFNRKTKWKWDWAGCRAGRINSHGYWMVTLVYQGRQRKVLAHRIVWALTHGAWPTQFIDHINRVRADNRPENLRDVSHTENMQNARRSGCGQGTTGAYATKGSKRFRSQIRRKGRMYYLGTFDTADEARSAFLTAAAEFDVAPLSV